VLPKWITRAGAALTVLWVLAPLSATAERVALVIGMGNYQYASPLDNTINDARGIAETLEGIGFNVTLALDASQADLLEKMDEFTFRAETADLALIYYAGHGVEVQGQNYLIPVDAEVRSNQDVQRLSVSLDQMLAAVDSARVMRIVILDACRNNPFGDLIDTSVAANEGEVAEGTTRGAGVAGLAPVNPDRGTLVAFAQRDGEVALDGTTANSPYARALMEHMKVPGVEIGLMFRQVRDEVLAETRNLQEPYVYNSLNGTPFYMAGPAEGQVDVSTVADPQQAWADLSIDQEAQLVAQAETGDTRSLLGLAYVRLNPADSRYSLTEAVSYLQRAADAGMPDAQFELAKLYEQGLGVTADPIHALELYQAAAAQDYSDAINDLGFLYYNGGLGLTADPTKALDYFRQAADLRHPEALFNYATLIDAGQIQGKGPEDAGQYLYLALRSGSQAVYDQLMAAPDAFSTESRMALQSQLQENEFYAGTLDGDFGPGTQAAIRVAYGLSE
jgi:uncharacterized protein